MLSQIDGSATLDEVADATGVPLASVVAIACRLEELGAIERPQPGARTAASGRYADVARPTPKTPTQHSGAGLVSVPRRTSADVYALKLETGDAFLLSNVDGLASVQELADIVGQDPARVMERVEALMRVGALELGEPSKRGSAARTRSAAKVTDPQSRAGRRSGAHDLGAAARSPRREAGGVPAPGGKAGRPSQSKLRAAHSAEHAPSKSRSANRPSKMLRAARADPSRRPSRADHAALPRHPVLEDAEVPPGAPMRAPPPKDDDACDLDESTRARIDAAKATAGGRTHYALLDVLPAASPKEISRAYFALAASLHPDRYFGRRLGPYKKKLEDAFRTVSDAYEVLRSPSRRAEYDAYLRLTRKSVEMEAALVPRVSVPLMSPAAAAPAAPPPVCAPPVVPAPQAPAPVEPPAAPVPSFSAPPPAFSGTQPIAPRISFRPPVSEAKVPVAARAVEVPPAPASSPRISQPPGPSSVVPPAMSTGPHSSARRLVAAAKSASMLQGAQQALVQGDALAAANLYRLALEYADDATSRAYAQSGLNEARSIVADGYLKSARYEEKESRWSDAVASYEKALDRRPDDPAICERLANALRQEGQDLVRATRLAELAVSRMPRNASCRRTLGLIYADAGLREKALEEFEKAHELDPSDEGTNRALEALRRARR